MGCYQRYLLTGGLYLLNVDRVTAKSCQKLITHKLMW